MSAPARASSLLTGLLVLVGVVVVAAVGGYLWLSSSLRPMPEALAALHSAANVRVTTDAWGVFEPRARKPRVGLIIYPATRVDWRAYAPSALAIAGKGFLVVIVPMPMNLAALGAERAEAVIQKYRGVRAWAIAGHGEGGAMAARFAVRHPRAVRALILWAARSPAGDSLGSSRISVLSISADRDGLVTPVVLRESASLLPASTRWVTIKGGNHAQFGWYGEQSRDGKALISRQQQQAKVVRATLEMLRSIAD